MTDLTIMEMKFIYYSPFYGFTGTGQIHLLQIVLI